MPYIIHIVVTAVALLLISKVLRGFEVDSFFTALLTAVILGLLHALLAPFAGQLGQWVGRIIAVTAVAYPVKIIMLFTVMLAVNALVLKFAAAIGPGFRISDFKTAVLGGLILVLLNGLIGEAVDFANSHISGIS
jgi:putative membrane protein